MSHVDETIGVSTPVSPASPVLKASQRTIEAGTAAGKFKVVTSLVVAALLLLDATGVFGLFEIYAKDSLANTVVAGVGLLAVNLALLMPLAQMWFAIEVQDPLVSHTVGRGPVITVVRDGTVRVRAEGDVVDVSIG